MAPFFTLNVSTLTCDLRQLSKSLIALGNQRYKLLLNH